MNPSVARAELELTETAVTDGLTRQYMMAVIMNIDARELAATGVSFGETAVHPALIPDDYFAEGWEEYTDDVRYWQLRYCLSRWAAIHGSDMPAYAMNTDAGLEYLVEAYERGLADWETILLLKPHFFYEYGLEAQAELDALDDRLPADEHHAAVVEILARQDSRELALLDESVAAGPDQAWTYWERGLHYFGLGELELAVADLTAGNNAPSNIVPLPFPGSLVLESSAGAGYITDPAYSGAIVDAMRFDTDFGRMMRHKERTKEAAVALNLGADLRLLQVLYETALGRASGERARLLDIKAAAITIQMILDYMLEEQGGVLTVKQRGVLLMAKGRCTELLQAIDSFGLLWYEWNPHFALGSSLFYLETYSIPPSAVNARPQRSQVFHDLLFSTREDAAYYGVVAQQVASEFQYSRETLHPMLGSLAELDLLTLEQPESWRNY